MPSKNEQLRRRLNLKCETVKINMCFIYDDKNRKVGKGFTITRSNAGIVGNWADSLGNEIPNPLPENWSIKHTEEEYLGNACWVRQ